MNLKFLSIQAEEIQTEKIPQCHTGLGRESLPNSISPSQSMDSKKEGLPQADPSGPTSWADGLDGSEH